MTALIRAASAGPWSPRGPGGQGEATQLVFDPAGQPALPSISRNRPPRWPKLREVLKAACSARWLMPPRSGIVLDDDANTPAWQAAVFDLSGRHRVRWRCVRSCPTLKALAARHVRACASGSGRGEVVVLLLPHMVTRGPLVADNRHGGRLAAWSLPCSIAGVARQHELVVLGGLATGEQVTAYFAK